MSSKLFLSILTLFVLASLPFISSVGASSTMWSRTYGGASSDSAEAMVQTSDGGYALAGYTTSFGAGSYDFWLVKTDEYGDMEWNQTYGGAGIEHAYSLVETSDGGYAIAGGNRLVKTDEYGNIEWNHTYSGEARSLVETSDGGFALAGYSSSLIDEKSDFWLVKTDAQGNMEWNKTYGGTDVEVANSLVEASDGGYALVGYTFGAGGSDFWLVKTDNYGNMEWSRTYGGAGSDRAHSLVETSDGGYALAGGCTTSVDAGPADCWLVKTDEYGNIPEFPSWLILPLLLVTTLAAIIYRKKLYRTQTQQSY